MSKVDRGRAISLERSNTNFQPPTVDSQTQEWLGARAVTRTLPLAPQVYRLFRTAIVGCGLQPGNGISEPDVAVALGVSRTPIREALLRLQREGFVDIRPQSGTYVTAVDWDRVEEGMIVREALEVRAIEAAAANLSDRLIGQLMDDTEAMRAASDREDLDGFMVADDGFHRHLLQASGYRHIPLIIEEVKGHLDRVRSLSRQTPQRMPRAIEEHQEIIHQIRKGDPTASARAMRKHLRSAWAVLRKLGRKNGLCSAGS